MDGVLRIELEFWGGLSEGGGGQGFINNCLEYCTFC